MRAGAFILDINKFSSANITTVAHALMAIKIIDCDHHGLYANTIDFFIEGCESCARVVIKITSGRIFLNFPHTKSMPVIGSCSESQTRLINSNEG